MTYVVMDTETSDLMDMSRAADALGQGRLAELAMIYVGDDLREQSTHHWFIRPEGWHMTAGASRVNGLTDEYLSEYGWGLDVPLATYGQAILEGCVVVGFNVGYDLKVLRGEMRRVHWPDHYAITRSICLMRMMTAICRIPGRRGWKWPKLSEACQHFGIEQNKSHSALGDAMDTVAILQKLDPALLKIVNGKS